MMREHVESYKKTAITAAAIVVIGISALLIAAIGPERASAQVGSLEAAELAVQAGSDDLLSFTVEATYGQTEARSMLSKINEFRQGDDAWYWSYDDTTKVTCDDLKPLSYDYALEKVAMQRAAEIALSFSHYRPNGKPIGAEVEEAHVAGENIAAGQTSADWAFDEWREDSAGYSGQGHRRNMLDSDYTSIGIGHVTVGGYHFWVQEFGVSASSIPATTAVDSERDVVIEVLSQNVTTRTANPNPYNIALYPGEVVDLPQIVAGVGTADTWPGPSVPVKASVTDWVSSDSSVVAIEDGKLVAKKPGKTALTATASLDEPVSSVATVEVFAWYIPSTTVLEIPDEKYDGNAKEPNPTVIYVTTTLEKDVDYTLSYSDNVEIGTASVTITGIGNYAGTKTATFEIVSPEEWRITNAIDMYRLYNVWTGEHFYTASVEERDGLIGLGWIYEGVGWSAPFTGEPVYRLYNSYSGDHHYTPNAQERDELIDAGWTDEDIGWYSDPDASVPLYREYNPNMFSCNHNYTTDKEEHDFLVSIGWRDEGYAWYGV